MVKKLLFVLFPLVCYNTIIYAQNNVQGVLLPKNLVNKHITLLKATDSTEISSTQANEKGFYSFTNIPNGHYYLKFAAKGYTDFISNDILLTNQKNTLIIDTVILEPIKIDLKEVVVVGEISILERKDNLLIFNVAKSAFSSSMNGIELLQMLPSINIGDNSLLTISGKSNVAVYINGKPSNIQGANLLDYLKNIQSNNIDQIEVLNGANAAIDASNNGGIINIKFKTATNLGYSTNLTVAGSLGRNYAYSGGLSISNKSQKNT